MYFTFTKTGQALFLAVRKAFRFVQGAFLTGRDVLVAKDDLLCHTAAHAYIHLGQELRARLTPAIVFREHGHLEGDRQGVYSDNSLHWTQPTLSVDVLCCLTCPRLGPLGMMVALLMGMASLV